MISSFQNKRALLLGNGINQLDWEQSISWGALLEGLKEDFGITVDIDNTFKPFPLGFEEMLHRKSGNNSFDNKLKNLKVGIRERIEDQLSDKVGYNEYHSRMMAVGYDDVLTTNYDYALQNSIIPNFEELKNRLAKNKQESKFSLKRAYEIPNGQTTLWHIHGELHDSRNLMEGTRYYHEESIMIGYEHYASYLEKIQENFKGKKGPQKPENQSLMMRIKNGVTGKFWTDVFFTHNVDIVGQGFDYSENHLWWLINQRANYKREYNEKYEVLVDNRIRFFFPEIEGADTVTISTPIEDIIRKRNSIEKSKGIAEVLEAFGVIPKPVKCQSYKDFYDELINNELGR